MCKNFRNYDVEISSILTVYAYISDDMYTLPLQCMCFTLHVKIKDYTND